MVYRPAAAEVAAKAAVAAKAKQTNNLANNQFATRASEQVDRQTDSTQTQINISILLPFLSACSLNLIN